MNIKKLLFLCLAFGTACINADNNGWLYKIFGYGNKSMQKSINTRTSYCTIGGIAVGATGIVLGGGLLWKKYFAKQEEPYRRIEIGEKSPEEKKRTRDIIFDNDEYRLIKDMYDACASKNLNEEKNMLAHKAVEAGNKKKDAITKKLHAIVPIPQERSTKNMMEWVQAASKNPDTKELAQQLIATNNEIKTLQSK